MELNFSHPEMSRYLQVYDYYKELIASGQMKAGSRLPSIRRCSVQLGISRTTVEAAYQLLSAEGYIIARPQSGYFVTEFFEPENRRRESHSGADRVRPEIRYDFASAGVDRESFQFDLWRRYIKSALRQDERLLSYGEPQGEEELRTELAGYLSRTRNVICSPENIVVGAGVQSLLHILCPMIRDRNRVCFYRVHFARGRQIFEDHGYRTEGPEAADAGQIPAGSICYLTPSQMTERGDVMDTGERMDLIRRAVREDILLIEDDYGSEFRYYSKPTPSLQGLSGGRGVVYLGTFSRLLLPSIRMSYMVLPEELTEEYRRRGEIYNQTASKAEQIALSRFIRDGRLESQIRKARKLYLGKTKRLCIELEKRFGDRVSIHTGEAGFLLMAEFKTDLHAEEIVRRAEVRGVAVKAAEPSEKNGRPRILLSCAPLPAEAYGAGLDLLYQSVYPS